MGKSVFRKQSGSAGKGANAPAAFPEVCQLPHPNTHSSSASPIPIPYPQIAMVSQSRKKVKVVRDAIIPRGAPQPRSTATPPSANAKMLLSPSRGGTANFRPYSMDVKVQGNLAVRSMDIMVHNAPDILRQVDETLVEYDATLRRAPSFTPQQAVRVQRRFEGRMGELLDALESVVGADERQQVQVKQLRGLVDQATSGRRLP